MLKSGQEDDPDNYSISSALTKLPTTMVNARLQTKSHEKGLIDKK